MTRLTTFLFLVLAFSPVAYSAPAQVLIIRHAEKPKDEAETGLSKKGARRAEALVSFFKTNSQAIRFGTPTAIYAMKQRTEETSDRAALTVQPLAKALSLKVQTPFTREKHAALVKEILENPSYDGKMVLICWEHDAIVPMAKEFGVETPVKWKDKDYSSVLEINFKDKKVSSSRRFDQNIDVSKDAALATK